MKLYNTISIFVFSLFGIMNSGIAQWQFEIIGNGSKPNMVVEPDGNVHIAYMYEDFNGYVEYARKTSDGFEKFNVQDGYLYAPMDLVLNNNGQPIIAYHDHITEDIAVAARQSNGNFSVSRVPSSGHDGWYPSIQIDDNNRGHIFSVDPTNGVEYMRQSNTGAWEVFSVYNSSMDYKWGMSTATTSSGDLYVSFGEDRTEELYFSSGSGGSWTNEVVIEDAYFPSMILGEQEQPIIAYFKEIAGNIGYFAIATKENNTWIHESVDTLNNTFIGFSGARNLHDLKYHDGKLHLLYSDRTVIFLAIRDENGVWTKEMVLNNASSGISLGQQVDLGFDDAGNTHITYHEDGALLNNGGLIWYGIKAPLQELSIQCAADAQISCYEDLDQLPDDEPVALINSGSEFDLSFDDELSIGICGSENTSISRSWTATNELGQEMSCTQNITILSNNPTINNAMVDSQNGSISYTLSCGVPPYTYAWSDGSTDQERSNLTPGSYTLTITDATGCEVTEGFAIDNLVPETQLSGNITDGAGLSLTDVDITVNNFGQANFTLCGDSSDDLFSLCAPDVVDSVELCFSKNGSVSEGVSAADLVKGQRIILQITKPCFYNTIALDANSSNSVSPSDLVLIRRLILEIQDTFPDQENWKFYAGTERVDCKRYDASDFPIDDLNIRAIKLGNLNCEDTLLVQDYEPIIRSKRQVKLLTNDINLVIGKRYNIPVRLESSMVLNALQARLNLPSSIFTDIEIDIAKPFDKSMMYHAEAEYLNLLWDDLSVENNFEHETVFSISFIANANTKLSDALSLSTISDAIAIDNHLNTTDLNLLFDPIQLSDNEWSIYPNPTSNEISIATKVVDPRSVIKIYTVTGKVVHTIDVISNHTAINTSDWHAGIYLIEIVTGEDRIVRKVVKE